MKNEYKITKQLVMSWAKEYHLSGVADIIAFVSLCILALCGLTLLTVNAAFGADWLHWFLSILFLTLAVYKLGFQRLVIWANRYKLSARTYGVSEWIRTTEFTEDEIIFTDHTSVNRFKYSNIKKIKEKNNVVMIFFNTNFAIRLYKDAFVDGSWEECKELLNSKQK